jgi:hypothetical protein
MEKYKIKGTNPNGETTLSNIEFDAETAYTLTSKFKTQMPDSKFEVIPTTQLQ